MSSAFANPQHTGFHRPTSNAWLIKGLTIASDTLAAMLAKFEPRALSRQEEAQQVRDMACVLAMTDPSFAEDLFAAADRHERE